MLILNILAGGAGIFFGMGIKGDLKTAEEAKSAAEAAAQSAKGGTSKLESDNQKLSNDIQTLQGQFAKATNDLGAAQATLASVQGGQGQMAADLQKAQQDNAQLQSDVAAAQEIANQTQTLKRDLAAYEALGTAQEIRTRLNKLTKIETEKADKKKKAEETKKPKAPTPSSNGPKIGSIASYDPKFNFYVINRGADHGIKNNDVYRVVRNGQLVGKIKIKQTQPTVAIADAIKEFTRAQLQAGDNVLKDN